MNTKTLRHDELDDRLTALAGDLEGFSEAAAALATELDAAGCDLEISDPTTWRRSSGVGSKVSLRQQFRAEVDAIEKLDREAEQRLARRIEFARIRFESALEAAGLGPEAIEGVTLRDPADPRAGCEGALPQPVCQRWTELHALRTELVERNLYLALINVERYAHTTVSQLDLIQEGAAALFRAVDGFDWRRGLLFRTYAVHWLNQAFRSFLYNSSNTVRVPVYLQKALKHINEAKNRLGNAKATVEQIAAEADLAENLVASAMAASRSSHSIDVSFESDEDGGRLRDLLAEDDEDGPYRVELEDVTLQDSIQSALEKLSDRERFVVCMRFGIAGVEREHTLAEVAEVLGVSLERVRQIQVRALAKLDNPHFKKEVDPFLN